SRGVLRLVHRATADDDVLETLYLLRTPDGTVTEYDASGRPRFKTTATGRRLNYLHDSEGRLTQVVDDRGHGFKFEYGAFDLVIAVEDTSRADLSGRRVEYCYDLKVLPYEMPPGPELDAYIAEIEAPVEEDGLGLGSAPGCYRYVTGMPDF